MMLCLFPYDKDPFLCSLVSGRMSTWRLSHYETVFPAERLYGTIFPTLIHTHTHAHIHPAHHSTTTQQGEESDPKTVAAPKTRCHGYLQYTEIGFLGFNKSLKIQIIRFTTLSLELTLHLVFCCVYICGIYKAICTGLCYVLYILQ